MHFRTNIGPGCPPGAVFMCLFSVVLLVVVALSVPSYVNRSPPTDDAVAEPELARGEMHPVQAQLEREGELLQLLRRQV